MVICTRNPCVLWICDLGFCEFLVHTHYSPTKLESNMPCSVWPVYSLSLAQYFFLLQFIPLESFLDTLTFERIEASFGA